MRPPTAGAAASAVARERGDSSGNVLHPIRRSFRLARAGRSVYNPGPMSRPWQYTRSRYFLMQAVMWLVLGATVGLAALVSRHRQGRADELSDKYEVPSPSGRVNVFLPKGWVTDGRRPRAGQSPE